MSRRDIDTIARCPQCRKLVGAHWFTGPWPAMKSPALPGWRLYVHNTQEEDQMCEGSMLVLRR